MAVRKQDNSFGEGEQERARPSTTIAPHVRCILVGQGSQHRSPSLDTNFLTPEALQFRRRVAKEVVPGQRRPAVDTLLPQHAINTLQRVPHLWTPRNTQEFSHVRETILAVRSLVLRAPGVWIPSRNRNKSDLQKCPTRVQNGLKYRSEIVKKRFRTATCAACCSQGRPGGPQGVKMVRQGTRMEAPGLPNDSFAKPQRSKRGRRQRV